MSILRVLLVSGMLVLLIGCATQGGQVTEPSLHETLNLTPLATIGSKYAVHLPMNKGLNFQGQRKSVEKTSSSGSVMYPGNNFGVFMASVIAHAAIQSSVNEGKNRREIKSANGVLKSYQSLIEQFSALELVGDSSNSFAGLRKSDFDLAIVDERKRIDGWYVAVDPVFIMSRSQDAITVQSEVTITDGRTVSGNNDVASVKPQYAITSVVQSVPVSQPEKWLENDGDYFKQVVSSLLQDSIDLAIRDFSKLLPERAEKPSTIRYLDNGIKRIERGFVIDETCSRIVFESLRGVIKSVIKFNQFAPNNCTVVTDH